MNQAIGLYYMVELSNGKSFTASRFNVINDRGTPDINNISFTIVGGLSYEEVLDLIKDPVTSITVKHCRPTSPPDYISAPDIFQTDIYDGFGATPSIEVYYNIGLNLKFFQITDALLELEKQTIDLDKCAECICEIYETKLS